MTSIPAPYDHGYDDHAASVIDEPTEYTAVRTWNGPHTKATVTVYADGVEHRKAGGARAARATAVVLAAWRDQELGLYGLRGDLAAAHTEAHRLATATERKLRGRYGCPSTSIQLTPAREAIAVPVTEAAS